MRHFMRASTAAVVLLTGCGEAGGPGVPGTGFDAEGVRGNIATVQQVLDDGTWRSLQILGPRFGIAGSAAGVAGRLTAGLAGSHTPSGAGVRIARAILSGGASLVAPQLPPAVRGTTFVLDPTTLQYVPDSTRTGAPANGVRFILYATDSSSEQPLPGQETGYLDLTDEAPPASPAIALRLQAIIAATTRLDYRILITGADSAIALEAAGYTDDGATRVALQTQVRAGLAADNSAAEVAFTIGIPSRAFVATATLQHFSLNGDSAGTIAMTVRQGPDQVGMLVHGSQGTITALFQVNGIPFATVQGDPEHPTIRGTDGQPLSPGEVEALVAIHRLTGTVLAMFDCVMRPVGGILGLQVPG